MLHFEAFVEQSQRAGTVAELKSLFVRVTAKEGFENHFGGTIECHVGNIFRKLGAGNRTSAVVIAIRNKLLEL